MFGLSSGQIVIIALVGAFVLGPERIPTATTWVLKGLGKARAMASGAQSQLSNDFGPELAQLRRQIAELQSLRELKELRELRDLNPKQLIGKQLLAQAPAGLVGGLHPEPLGDGSVRAAGTELHEPIAVSG